MIKLASLFGVNLSIYAAFNTVWLATSGLVWPIAIQLYASYFTRRLSHSAQSVCSPRFANVRKSSARNVASVVVPLFPAILALIIPPLAVASASHPFQMLASGPLIAFGLAATLLPFWLYATLRLLDALATREHLVKWIIWFFVTAGVCMFAHPRIVFTWLLLMAPFVLTRLPWKAIAGLAGVVVLGAAVFLVYMMSSYKSDRYFNPASWFHTFVPNRTVPEALKIYVTDNIGGVQGWFMAAIVLIAFAVTVAAIIRPQWFAANRADSATVPGASAIDRASDSTSAQPHEQVADFAAMPADRRNRKTSVSYRTPRSDASQLRRDAIAILLAFFLVGLVFAAVVLLRAGRLPNVTKIIAIVLLAALAISCQFGNTVRSALSDAVYANMTIDDARPDEQLTATKEKILKKVVKETGTDSVVVSDPLNGSMYATAMYGADMLFPIYNAKAEKNGAIFGQTENAFASGDGRALTNTVCPLSADGDAYFLSMGGQAPSLQMFTFKQQYDTFHDQKLIDQYAKDGTMRKVQDYSNMASYAKGWALYQFNCQ